MQVVAIHQKELSLTIQPLDIKSMKNIDYILMHIYPVCHKQYALFVRKQGKGDGKCYRKEQ